MELGSVKRLAAMAVVAAVVSVSAADDAAAKRGGKGTQGVVDVEIDCAAWELTVSSSALADGTEAHPISNIVVVADNGEVRIEEPFAGGDILAWKLSVDEYTGIAAVYVKAGNNGMRGYGERFDIDLEAACSADRDGDGLDDDVDNCPDASNPVQFDFDGDGAGDVCDADADGDGSQGALGDGSDCNDLDSAVRPGVIDAPADDVDQNCDGRDPGAVCLRAFLDEDRDGVRGADEGPFPTVEFFGDVALVVQAYEDLDGDGAPEVPLGPSATSYVGLEGQYPYVVEYIGLIELGTGLFYDLNDVCRTTPQFVPLELLDATISYVDFGLVPCD